jgi:alkylation response protein AidB-like acyl-CoA dehydrogenase
VRFHFTEDQRLLRDTVRDFLTSECTVDHVRELWGSETGRSPAFWSQLAEIGLPGLLVPEAFGGMGMDEIDLVLLLEETGRAALTAPVISTAAIAAPLIRDLGSKSLAERWLPKLAGGEAIVAVGHAVNAFVSDAHVADLLLLPRGDEVHTVPPSDVKRTPQRSNDPSRRLFSVEWTPSETTRVAEGPQGRALLEAALDRGALACAAQQLGVAQQLIDMAVAYASQREQFGAPIGSFQAVKHQLADLAVKLEYARPVVYRAAHSVARDARTRAVDVSMAKLAASEAALAAAKTALQIHGAIGYTWEQDLHVWMRRAWSLELSWGSGAWHRARVAGAVLDGAAPAETFGYSPPSSRAVGGSKP